MNNAARFTRMALACSAAAGALLSAGVAAAQSNEAGSTVVEELVVTADKREMNLQEVPASVSAVSGDVLVDQGLRNISDYTAYIPGLNITNGGSPGQTVIVLRGIAPVGPTAVIGSYIDETPMGSSTAYARATEFSLDLMPYDMERFEVLRGPQGTLYGASSMGGLIKYVLKKADPNSTSGQIGGDVAWTNDANAPGYSLRGAFNAPLIEGKLALRASVFNTYDQGYVDNYVLSGPFAGKEEDTNDVHQYGSRVAATWKPTENVSIYGQAMWYRLHSDDNAQVSFGNVTEQFDSRGARFINGSPTLGDLAQSHSFKQPFDKSIDYYSGTIDWDAGPVSVISATSYSKTKTNQTQDAEESFGVYTQLFGLPPGRSFFNLSLDLEKFSQEVRIVSPEDQRFTWILGGFYTHENSSNGQLVKVFDENFQDITDPALSPIFNPFFALASLPTKYQEWAAFGDLTFNVTDKFDITGGIRYAKNDQTFSQISDGLILGGFTEKTAESSEDIVTWMANARYRFSPDLMAYARVATGYRPGGPNVAILGLPETFESDKLTSYEAGVRSTFLDGRAQLNVTAFNIDWTNIQLSVFNAARNVSGLGNAGDAFSRGLELEGVFVAAPGLRIGFNAAYTKAELTEVKEEAPLYLLGYQLPNVPEFTGAINVDYEWTMGDGWNFNVGGNVRYVDDTLADAPIGLDTRGPAPTPASPVYLEEAHTLVDLRAGVAHDNWKLNFYARNLFDERVYQGGYLREDAATGATPFIDVNVNRPRTIGLAVDVNF